MNYEERTKTIENPDGSESEETYVVAVAVTDKVELFEKISTDYGTSLTYEQQSNAVNVWYLRTGRAGVCPGKSLIMTCLQARLEER